MTYKVDKSLIAAYLSSAAGGLIFLLLPIIIGWMTERFNFTETQVGLVASIYFLGFLITSVLAFLFFGKLENQIILQLGYSLLTLGLISCGFATNVEWLASSLALCGIGSGLLYGTGVSIVSNSQDSERSFGAMLATQQAIALILIYSLPTWIFPSYGYLACWLALAMVVGAISVSSGWVSKNNTGKAVVGQNSRSILLTLTSLMIHFCLLSAVWAFVERLGVDRGFSRDEIALSLALSLLGGLAGALSASFIGNRWGSLYPYPVSAFIFILTFYFLAQGSTWVDFLGAIIIFSFTWSYCLAYQMASIGKLSHRVAVLIPGVQGIAAMLGPALGGWIIGQSGYQGLMLGATIAILIASSGFFFGSTKTASIKTTSIKATWPSPGPSNDPSSSEVS